MRKKGFVLIFLVSVLFISSCSNEDESKNFEKKLNDLLSQIVVELKSPRKVSLTPRTFIELNAILMVSNYMWTKSFLSSSTNPSSDILEQYRNEKKKELLSQFEITVEEFENYSIKNYKALQEFSEQNPEIIQKYNELSALLPTLFEDF